MKKCLILDDSSELAEAVSYIVQSLDIDTCVETDPVAALENVDFNKIDFILTDVRMPVLDGFGFAKKVREMGFDKLPIIFMSGYVGEENFEKLKSDVSSLVIEKPFSADELKERINYLMPQNKDKPNDLKARESFVPISIANILTYEESEFNIYLKVSGKFTLLLKKGNVFDENRLKSYQSKAVDVFFVKYNELLEFFKFEIKFHLKEEDFELKESVLSEIKKSLDNDKLDILGDNKAIAAAAKDVLVLIFTIVESRNILNTLESLCSSINGIMKHNLNVAILSRAVANSLQGLGEELKFQITLAALLHDLGGLKLSLTEWKSEDEHSALGVKHLEDGASLVNEMGESLAGVEKYILLHHERIDGSGPLKKSKEEIPFGAQIISLSDSFIHDLSLVDHKFTDLDGIQEKYLKDSGHVDQVIMDAFNKAIFINRIN